MKKIPIISIFALILICAFSVFAFTYQAKIPAKEAFASDSAYMQSENLALNADCDSKKLTDGKAETSFQSLKKENFYVTIDLGKSQKINSVILKEKGLNVKEFFLSVSVDGATYSTVYQNDKIEYHRLCTFDDIEARYVRLTVTKADSFPAIREIEIYYESARNIEDFRITAYLAAEDVNAILYDESLNDKQKEVRINQYFDDFDMTNLTHFYHYCGVVFDGTGTVYLGGKDVDQEERIKQQKMLLGIIRERLSPEAKISFVFGFSQGHEGRNSAMRENQDIFIENLIDVAKTLGFDGIDIDYEFPQTKEDFQIFSDFLVALKKAMRTQLGEDSILSCAFGTRDLNFTQEAKSSLDMINIMTYDIMDQDGQHASFWSCTQQAIAYAEEAGFERSQINLGIPFYGTQTEAIMEQYIFRNLPRTDYYQNTYTVNGYFDSSPTSVFFNSPAMVRDKTAFALLNGCGVMVWSLSCDTAQTNENSLWKAVNDAASQFGGGQDA
ncbi:MAG: glycosyl hydrolase family 18 protein [Acutalibacteraceae bacterium]